MNNSPMQYSYEHHLRTICRARNPKNILEWGPGKSTRMMVEECPGAKILSIEHELKYINRFMAEGCPENVTLIHKTLDMKGGTSQGYITWPLYLKEKYDLIFIDGRFRFDCIMIASLLLNEKGVVIVHDTHRKIYHPAFNLFSYNEVDEEKRTTVLSNSDKYKVYGNWWTPLSRENTLYHISKCIEYNAAFYHVRFGDGELYCTEDPMFANKRHQPKDDKLSQEIIEALQIDSPFYQIAATMSGWNEGKLRGLRRILSKYFHKKEFYYVTFLHETFLEDFEAFKKFTDLFKGKKVLLIAGPTACNSKHVHNAFNVGGTIQLSDTNAYYMLDEMWDAIKNEVQNNDIIISGLGWASTVLAKRLWNLKIKTKFIDIGSVVDALAGVNTRGWIKKNWEYVQEKRKCFS